MAKVRVRPQHEIAGVETDPWYRNLWTRLPNPDTVLRRLRRDQEIYDQILLDAHVMGEMRAIRAGLLDYEWRIVPGDDSRAGRRAADLAREVMARAPTRLGEWSDTLWTIAGAVWRGYAVHEVVWARDGMAMMPATIVDRPNRRIVFLPSGEPRLLTQAAPYDGVPIPDRSLLITRHMASYDNPYGVAVLSSVFWPYVFKHSGYRYFTTFCERFGIPWLVGKVPAGLYESRADDMEEKLAAMVRHAIAVVPEDTEVDTIDFQQRVGGQLPQERLIAQCNREISKALTSQTLASEHTGEGSRAATETHRAREQAVNMSDRALVSATLNRLFRWVTDVNVGVDAPGPRHEFYEESSAQTEWAEVYETARHYLPIPAAEAYERLGITPPEGGEDVLPGGAGGGNGPPMPPAEFAARADLVEQGFDALLQAVDDPKQSIEVGEQLARPLLEAIERDPDLLLGRIAESYPDLDADGLQALLARAMFVAELWGRASADH